MGGNFFLYLTRLKYRHHDRMSLQVLLKDVVIRSGEGVSEKEFES